MTTAILAPTAVEVNDVHSRLNPTVLGGIFAPGSMGEIQAAIRDAEMPICIACGRHAMGAQQFGTGALLLDMNRMNRVLDFDPVRGLVEVEAGIQWPELIHFLQPTQWAVTQKQTGADRLSIGGAVSANIHGRGLRCAPLVGDVESVTLVRARGELVKASRHDNPELFRLAVGGYGLFGVLTSVTLRLRPRQRVRRVVELIRVGDLMVGFEKRIAEGYLYGDFQFMTDEASSGFLREGVFSCYHPVAPETPLTENLRELSVDDWNALIRLAHTDKAQAFERYASFYMGTSGQVYESDAHQLGVYLDNYHASLDRERGAASPASEVITEIYVPRPALTGFMEEARKDFRRHGVNLIYGTVRLIERDEESFLAWAKESYACVIFNLHTEHTRDGLRHSAAAFRRLIDMAISRGGSYYLTYHKHATREQVEACYPQFSAFLRHKIAYDPQERFQSDWYRHYKGLS